MKALKDALHDGFGVAPSHVVQSSYEPIQFDENGALCGSQPTLGIDVHPGLKLSRERLEETADFLDEFSAAASNASPAAKGARGCSSRSCDRRRHRLHAGDRPHSRIRQARHLRARSQTRARRRSRHAHAAPAAERRSHSSPIRPRRHCPMPTTGACSARRTMLS